MHGATVKIGYKLFIQHFDPRSTNVNIRCIYYHEACLRATLFPISAGSRIW